MSSDTCCHRSECATNAESTGRIFSLGPLALMENVKSSVPDRVKHAWRKSCIALSLRSEHVSCSVGQNLTVRCISTHNLGRDSATLCQKLQILPSSQGMDSKIIADLGTLDFLVPNNLVERISREAGTDACYSNMRAECIVGIDRGEEIFRP